MNAPHKNVNDKVLFPKGTILPNDAEKEYHIDKDGLLCYEYPGNHGTSAKLKAKNNLRIAKSTCIRKVKSQSDHDCSTYCHSRNLELQAKRNCAGKNHGKACNENINAVSNKIKYPNYLKASSKLKERNHLYLSNNNTNSVKSQLQNECQKIVRDNPDIHIEERKSELQTVIEENEQLKKKLNTVVQSLREVLKNCNEEDDEIKRLQYDIDYRKRIKYENDHFKFQQKEQCHHFKNIDAFEVASIKSNQRTDRQSLCCQMIMLNDVLGTSAYKSDLEKTKALNSKQYLVELEKQNRIIIRSLNELKENFKKTYKLQNLETSNNKNRSYLKVKSDKTSNFSKSVESSAIIKQKIADANKSAAPLKKQSEMLREMIKFGKLMKAKSNSIKDHEAISIVTKSLENDVSAQKVQNLNEKSLESKQDVFPLLSSNTSSKNYTGVANVQRENKEFRNPSSLKKNGIENFYKTTNKGSSREYSTQTTKMKAKIHRHQASDDGQLQKSTDSEDDVRQFVSVKSKRGEIHHSPKTLTHTDILMKKTPYSKANSSSRKSYPECNSFSSSSVSKAVKSCDDNVMVLRRGLCDPSSYFNILCLRKHVIKIPNKVSILLKQE